MGQRRIFLGFTTEGKRTLLALKEHPHPLLVSAACSLSQGDGGEPQLLPGAGGAALCDPGGSEGEGAV